MWREEIRHIDGKSLKLNFSGSDQFSCMLLHGFLESSKMWRPLTEMLTNSTDYCIPDLPGHGNSDLVDGPKTIENVSHPFNKLLRDQPAPVFLVGHSLGGYVALEMARNVPDKVAGIFLFHSTANADSEERKESREQGKRVVKKDKERYLKMVVEGLFPEHQKEPLKEKISALTSECLEMKTNAISFYLEAMKSRRASLDMLKDRHFPLYYFEGIHDPILDIQMLKSEIEQLNPEGAHWSDKAGHMAHPESPHEAADAINLALRNSH